MQPSNYFFLIFILALVITRVWSVETRIASPTIVKFRTHHYMYGAVVVGLGILFSNITVYAIGLGMVVDELPLFVLWRKWRWKDYTSLHRILGLIVAIVFVYVFRNYLIWPVL